MWNKYHTVFIHCWLLLFSLNAFCQPTEFKQLSGEWSIKTVDNFLQLENLTTQHYPLIVTQQNKIRNITLKIELTILSGEIAGIVFRFVDQDNFYVLNFYRNLRRVYLYRRSLGSFTELAMAPLPNDLELTESVTIEVSCKEDTITATLQDKKLFTITDAVITGGGYGFRTESTRARFKIIMADYNVLPENNSALINYNALYASQKFNAGETMLFYGFNKDNIKNWKLLTSGTLTLAQAENEELSVQISFDRQFSVECLFYMDISGYKGLEIDCSAPKGRLYIHILDCFSQTWVKELSIENGRQKITLNFDNLQKADFIKSPIEKKSPWRLPYPASIESLKLTFSGEEFPGDQHPFFLHSLKPFGSKGLAGPSIAVDPEFALYKIKGWHWTAEALKNLGFTTAEIIIIKDLSLEKQNEIVSAFHTAGIKCVLRLYPTTDFVAFEQHPEWHQRMLDGTAKFDWRAYLCPNNEEFVAYLMNKIETILRNVDYDAIELCEPWFEVWGGPYKENPNRGKYACVCDKCVAKFRERAGIDPRLLFTENSPHYFEHPENQALYSKWVKFRIDSINNFSHVLFQRAKQIRPGLPCAITYAADCRVKLDAMREYQAQDLPGILTEVKPDILIIQDAWQDWTQPNLPPEFVEDYATAYVQRVRRLAPHVILKVHSDIGSLKQMQRTYTWMRRFSAFARNAGFDAPVYYEFTLGDYSR